MLKRSAFLILAAACRGRGKNVSKSTIPKHAIVTPFFPGDAHKVARDMNNRWQLLCPPDARSKNQVDLVLYYSRVEDEIARRTVSEVPARVRNCFREVRFLCADLTEEMDAYPVGPGHQFFRIFLHPVISSRFEEYSSFSIVERDCYITRAGALEELIDAAFGRGGKPDFWVKGGSLAGVEFHETARDRQYWDMLGHVNGNGIYSLSDPQFHEFVNYTTVLYPPIPSTLYPFDVALWATIANFPYSWPLWQRFTHMFVHSHLFSNMGLVSGGDLSSQPAAFVHGSMNTHFTGGGVEAGESEGNSDSVCPDGCLGTGTAVCDATCRSGMGQRWGGFDCQTGERTQACRRCYLDLNEALKADAEARLQGGRVIMCNTRMPPVDPVACPHQCGTYEGAQDGKLTLLHGVKDTICDTSCSSDNIGYGCGAAGVGPNCRFCFMDEQEWLLTGGSKTPGVMCFTLEQAPSTPEIRELLEDQEDGYFLKQASLGQCTGLPCSRTCVKNSKDLVRGRRCDLTCLDSTPSYDGVGCNHGARHGCACRACFTDRDKARRVMHHGELALMCDTMKPPNIYTKKFRKRQPKTGPPDKPEPLDPRDTTPRFPFEADGLCILMRGFPSQMDLVSVGVQSAWMHVPHAKVVVAVSQAWYENATTFGEFAVDKGIEEAFVPTADDIHKYAELFADSICGNETNNIYYLPPGAVFTRTPQFLDVKRPLGEEVVVSYVGSHQLPQEALLWRNQNLALLGWPTPCFSHGQDVILPREVNRGLRQRLRERSNSSNIVDQLSVFGNDFHAVELLAGYAYGTQPKGVSFQDATEWAKTHVTRKPANIWEIPLIKPPYTCRGDVGRHGELLQDLRQSARGSVPCPHGWIYTPDVFLTEGGG